MVRTLILNVFKGFDELVSVPLSPLDSLTNNRHAPAREALDNTFNIGKITDKISHELSISDSDNTENFKISQDLMLILLLIT